MLTYSVWLLCLLRFHHALAQTSVLPPPPTYTSGTFLNPDTAASQVFSVGAAMNVTWTTTYSGVTLYLIYGTDYNAPYLCISGTSQTWWMWEPIDDHGHNTLPFSFRAVDAGGSATEQRSDGFYTGQFWLQEEVAVAATTSAQQTIATPTPTPVPATITVTQSQSSATTTPSSTPTTASSTPTTSNASSSASAAVNSATTASHVASSVSSLAATTGSKSNPVSNAAATTSPATASSTSAPTPSPTPTLAIGLGVGLGVALLLVAVLAFCFLRRRRRQPTQQGPPSYYVPELGNSEKPSGHTTPSWMAELYDRRAANYATKSAYEATSMTSPRELYGDSPSAHSRGASPVYGAGMR